MLLFAMLWMVSCSNDATPGISSDVEITFGLANSDEWNDIQESRAVIVNKAELANKGFGVFAYYAKETPDFMNNTKVYSTNGGTKWTYSPVKYWPNNKNDKLSFFAYAPYNANTTIEGSKINFTVNETVKNQVDLMWSKTNTVNLTRTDNAISMHFLHALSKIGFTAQANIEGSTSTAKVNIRVKKLVLTSSTDTDGTATTGPFYMEGTLDLRNTANSALWTETTTTGRKFSFDYSNFKGAPDTGFLLTKDDNGTPKQLNADDSYVMIIPQDLSSTGFNVYVEYEVRLERANPAVYESYTNKRTGTVKFNFEAGKAYTLNLIFGLDEFTIDDTIRVVPWTGEAEVEINGMVP